MLKQKKGFYFQIILVGFFFSLAQGEILYEEQFNYPNSDEMPPNWFDDHASQDYGPSWSIRDNCLYHRHVERGDPEVPGAFYTAQEFGLDQPITITVRLKAMTKTARYNSVETGILFRVQDDQPSRNHYRVCFEFHSGGPIAELKISPWSTRYHYSTFHSLSPIGEFELREWYILKVVINRYQVECYVNDTFIARRDLENDPDNHGRIPSFTYPSGKIGFTALDGEEAYFDYIIIESFSAVSSPSLKEEKATLPYPNPFNPECYLPVGRMKEKERKMKVRIYNILGQLVREIEIVNLKSQSVYWDGKDSCGLEVPSGVYFYEAQGEGVRRMLVLK
jgi:hypothetical protein